MDEGEESEENRHRYPCHGKTRPSQTALNQRRDKHSPHHGRDGPRNGLNRNFPVPTLKRKKLHDFAIVTGAVTEKKEKRHGDEEDMNAKESQVLENGGDFLPNEFRYGLDPRQNASSNKLFRLLHLNARFLDQCLHGR